MAHPKGTAHRSTWFLAGALWAGLSALTGAVPVLEQLHPPAIQVGTTREITAVGKFDPWPTTTWVSGDGLRVETLEEKGRLRVTVATDAATGPRLIRLFNAEGASAPRFLLVSADPQTDEQEPNDDFRNPQVVATLPASVNGRLEKNGDVDVLAVELAAGQTLVAAVEAHVWMSPVDAVLRLVGPDGSQAAWNHDDGRTLDPFLAFTAPRSGRYGVQVFGFAHPADSDIRFTGNARCVYRLLLTTGPAISHARPLGVRRGGQNRVRIDGWNLPATMPGELVVDGTGVAEGVGRTEWRPPGFHLPFELAAGDGEEEIESEPNDVAAVAGRLRIPGAVTGDLNATGDRDRYRFEAKKGERLRLAVKAAAFGFPLDAWLAVEGPDGKELVRQDDSVGSDPAIEWTAPSDGVFVAAVGSLLQKGGDSLRYRIEAAPIRPGFKATVTEDVFPIAPGATNEIKVTLTRSGGFEAPIRLTAEGLPQGIRAAVTEAGPKESEAVLRLVAATDANPTNGTFRIVVAGGDPEVRTAALHELVSSGENNGVPQGFRRLKIEAVEDLWLTVTPPPPAKDGAKKP